jgi:hypothetical protein
MAEPFGGTREVVTLVLAVWGALLSTFTFLRARRDQKARLKVGFGPSMTEQRTKTVMLYAVFVKNIGLRDVHFDSFCTFIELDGVNEPLHFDPPDERPLPAVLKPGDSFTAHLPRGQFNSLIKQWKGDGMKEVRVRGGVVDAIDQRFKSKWVSIAGVDTKDTRVSIGGLFDE